MSGFLSPAHTVVLVVVLLLVFGAKRLPELGREMGTGLREFKRSIGGEPCQDRPALAAAPDPVAQPASITTPDDAVERPATRPAA